MPAVQLIRIRIEFCGANLYGRHRHGNGNRMLVCGASRFYAPTVHLRHHHFANPRLLPPLPRKLKLFVVSDMNMNLNLSINAAVGDLAYDSEDEAEGLTTVRFRENPHLMQEVERLLSPEERTILEKNTVPNFDKFTSPKWNPFHTLAASGQILILDDVLKQGIDVNATNEDGMTALHKAVLCKKEAVVSRLLKRGANPHLKDKSGATALHYAVLVGATQTVKLLIKHKIDVNATDNDGWTPLHVAVQTRVRYIAKVLLLNGADKTIKNKDGNTAFDVAISMGKGFRTYEITKLLKLVPSNHV